MIMPFVGAALAWLFYDYVFVLQFKPVAARQEKKLEVSTPDEGTQEEQIDDEEKGHLNETKETPMLEESKVEG